MYVILCRVGLSYPGVHYSQICLSAFANPAVASRMWPQSLPDSFGRLSEAWGGRVWPPHTLWHFPTLKILSADSIMGEYQYLWVSRKGSPWILRVNWYEFIRLISQCSYSLKSLFFFLPLCTQFPMNSTGKVNLSKITVVCQFSAVFMFLASKSTEPINCFTSLPVHVYTQTCLYWSLVAHNSLKGKQNQLFSSKRLPSSCLYSYSQ